MILRLSKRSVVPEDFTGLVGVCQNLDCGAPLEPPLLVARVAVPGGHLDTVLCCNCAPRKKQDRVQIRLVDDPPVLELPPEQGE